MSAVEGEEEVGEKAVEGYGDEEGEEEDLEHQSVRTRDSLCEERTLNMS